MNKKDGIIMEKILRNGKSGKITGNALKDTMHKGVNLGGDLISILTQNYRNDTDKEQLVNGAILTCSRCTKKDVIVKSGIIEFIFKAGESKITQEELQLLEVIDEDKVYGKLNVTSNLFADTNGLLNATINDSKRKIIIPFFGNCIESNGAKETKILQRNLDKNRNEGSCKFLMELETEWENYEIGKSLFSYNTDAEKEKPTITMTSVLFCKRGGLIYPVTSGQINIEKFPVHISKEGMWALICWEILNKYSKSMGYLVIQNNKLIAIKPHKVGDNSITVGIGDWITPEDVKFYRDKGYIIYLPDHYDENVGNYYTEGQINEALKKTKDLDIKLAIEKFEEDIAECEKNINKFLNTTDGVTISQRQYDALIIMRYQMGPIGEDILQLIEENLWDRTEWENTVNDRRLGKQSERTSWEMEIMFGTEEYPLQYGEFEALADIVIEGLK